MNDSRPIDTQRKRLLWRATHRGIKEMDLVIGGFAQARLASMSEQDVQQFEMILDIPDQDLLAWLTGQAAVPANLATPLLHDVLKFRPDLTA